MAGTGTTLFSGGSFFKQLRFGRNWFHIIFRRIVLKAAQIRRELAPHYFPADSSRGSSDLAGTGSTLFSGRLFWRQLRFGANWLHIIFQWNFFGGSSDLAGTGSTLFSSGLFWIVFEAAQIWWELAPLYFPADYFVFCSDLTGTGSTLFSGGWFLRQLRLGGNWLHIIFWQIVLEAAHIWQELGSTLFSSGLFWRQLRFGRNWLHIIFWQIVLEAA